MEGGYEKRYLLLLTRWTLQSEKYVFTQMEAGQRVVGKPGCWLQVQSAIFGLSGFRPSQGALSSEGMARVVGKYDSVAWLVRDPCLHVKIAEAFKLPGDLFLHPTSVIVMDA